MNTRIKEKIKNEKGNVLPFVLIIGFILLLMTTSLLAVANSGVTFTQETVESRQAYIDAKSVIEFGKIEITGRMTALNAKNEEIENEEQKTIKDIAKINALKAQRDQLKTALVNPFTIYGVKDSVTENLVIDTLSLAPGSVDGNARVALGVCSVVPTVVNSTNTQYTFDIKTQELRRKLDYKVNFNYATTTVVGNWTNVVYTPIGQPDSGNWLKTSIWTAGYKLRYKINGTDDKEKFSGEDWPSLSITVPDESLNIGRDKNNDKFEWINGKTLNIVAKEICVSADLPTNTSATYQIEASNVIFKNGVKIPNYTDLIIECDNLWVEGDIVLGENSTLTVAGTTEKTTNQMIVSGMIKTERTANGNPATDDCEINISNLAYFQCAGLDIYGSDLLELESKNMVINGPVSLINLDGSKNEIKTQYLDCSGKTTISNAGTEQNPLIFTPIDHKLFIRFAGGYDQRHSHVDINGADKVVFGTSFYLTSQDYRWYSWYDRYDWFGWHYGEHPSIFYWDHLYIKGDNIYLEGSSIQMKWSSFVYEYSKNGSINVYIQSKVTYLDHLYDNYDNLDSGSYNGITRRWYNINQVWGRIVSEDLTRTGDYPGSPGSSGGGKIKTGSEEYY